MDLWSEEESDAEQMIFNLCTNVKYKYELEYTYINILNSFAERS